MSMMVGLVRDWFDVARSRRARPFLLVAFLVDVAFLFIFLVAIQSYLPEQYGGGRGLPGYSLAAYGLAKLVAQLFAGRLADRLGHARAALVGVLFILTGQVALLAAVAIPYAALPSAAIYGFGAAVLWPALYARASHEFAEGERAKLAAALSVTTGIALVCGLSLGLLLPGRFPYWAAVILGAAVVGLAVIPTIALRRDGAYTSTLEQENPTLRAMIATALDRRRIEFALIILLESAAVGALQAIFRAYGRDFLGVSFRLELLYLVPAMLAGAAAVVIGGALADRLGRLLLVGTGYIAAGVALWLLAGITTPFVLIPLAAAGGVGAGLAMPAISALSMDLSRTAGQGTVLAWFMVMEGLGHAGGAGAGGWLNTTSDPAAVLRLAGVLFLVTGAGAAISVAGWPGSWASRAKARWRSTMYPENAG